MNNKFYFSDGHSNSKKGSTSNRKIKILPQFVNIFLENVIAFENTLTQTLLTALFLLVSISS